MTFRYYNLGMGEISLGGKRPGSDTGNEKKPSDLFTPEVEKSITQQTKDF